MRLVDRQVTRELIGPFFFGVAAFSSVFFAGAVLPKLTEWLMNGMPIGTAMQLVILSLPSIVVYTLPMSTLLAVLLGVGRLSGDSEIVALFAGGVSLYRITVPIIALGLAVSFGSVVLNEVVAPRANLRNKELQAAVFKTTNVTDRPFTFVDEGTNALIRVNGGLDVHSGVLKDVTIIKYLKTVRKVNGKEKVVSRPQMLWHAARARWEGLNDHQNRYRWKLYDGSWWLLGDGSTMASGSFDNQQTRDMVISKTPQQLALYQKDPEQMSFSELSRLVTQVKAHPDRTMDEIRRLDVERWNKLALPLSSLVFAMLAAPLGIRPHRGSSSVGLGLSIFVIFIYWMVWRYTSQLAVQGSLTPIFGAFVADALGVIAAVVLLKRAAK